MLMKRFCSLHNFISLYKSFFFAYTTITTITDRKYAKRVAEKERENKERDARMKYGKSYKKYTGDAGKAKSRLRPGEVRRYDKEKGKWVSNKD